MLDSIQPPKKVKISRMNRIRENRKTKMLVIGLIVLILIIPCFYLLKTGLAFKFLAHFLLQNSYQKKTKTEQTFYYWELGEKEILMVACFLME